VAGYRAQQAALAKAMRGTDAAFYNYFLRGTNEEGAIVFLHPTSRGTVLLNTTNPVFGEPLVDYRALSNPADAEILVEFVHFTRRLMRESRFRTWGPVELSPGANLTTSEQLVGAIRRSMNPSTFHPVGTAAMMPRRLGGVVDENLLVYGVNGLSIADASVIPDLPGAYTQQTVYAIGEKVRFDPSSCTDLRSVSELNADRDTGRGSDQVEGVRVLGSVVFFQAEFLKKQSCSTIIWSFNSLKSYRFGSLPDGRRLGM
jgi:hypothetical protein